MREGVSRELAAFPVGCGKKILHFPTMPFGNYSSRKYCGQAGRLEQGTITLNPHQDTPGLSSQLTFLFILLVYADLLSCFLVTGVLCIGNYYKYGPIYID